MTTTERAPEVMRFFTRALKIPTYIGQFVDGTRLPGGPYTATQGFTAGAVIALGYPTRGMWGTGREGLNLLLLLAVAYACARVIVFLPDSTRNPLLVGMGGARVVFGSSHGQMGGQALKVSPPCRVRGRLLVGDAAPSSSSAPLAQLASREHVSALDVRTPGPPLSVPFPSPGAVPVSSVAQLLATGSGKGR